MYGCVLEALVVCSRVWLCPSSTGCVYIVVYGCVLVACSCVWLCPSSIGCM